MRWAIFRSMSVVSSLVVACDAEAGPADVCRVSPGSWRGSASSSVAFLVAWDGLRVDGWSLDLTLPDCEPRVGQLHFASTLPLGIDTDWCQFTFSWPCRPGVRGGVFEVQFTSPTLATANFDLIAPANDCAACRAILSLPVDFAVATDPAFWSRLKLLLCR